MEFILKPEPSADDAPKPATHTPVQSAEGHTSQAVQTPPQRAERIPETPTQPPVQQTPTKRNAPSGSVGSMPVFPDPWGGYLANVPKKPSILWTYMELGLDMGGQVDMQRRQTIQKVLQNYLKLPPGTSMFWPVAALIAGALQPNTELFWRGWELKRPPYIACFGDEALRVIVPDMTPGNRLYMLEQVSVHVLPPMSRFVHMLPHEQQLALEPLANLPI